MSDVLGWRDLPDADLVAHMGPGASTAARDTAFDVIYQRHSAAVLAVCGGLLHDDLGAAESAAAESLTVAYRDLTAGRPPREPEKLRAWLYGIARHRCQEELRRRSRAAVLPDDVADDDYEAASRRRRAEVDRILDTVAASFTQPQQHIFQLSTRQGLRGRTLATALAVSDKEAYDDAWENKIRLWEGFGAYVLAQGGRPYCPDLARILDAWEGEAFSRVLRLRLLRHLNNCATCDNCATCQTVKKDLVRPLAPVLIPILAAAALRDRVMDSIREAADVRPARQGPPPPPPPAKPPATGEAAARSGTPGQPTAPGRRRRRPLATVAGGATVVLILGLAVLFVTGFGRTGSPSPPAVAPAADVMPTLAYATSAALVVRQGTAAPRTLSALPTGSSASQLSWSAGGRWLAWFTGPPGGGTAEVHTADVTTGVTRSWACSGCLTGAFQGNHLLVGDDRGSLTAYPLAGGPVAQIAISGLPRGTGLQSSIELIGSTPHDAAVVFFYASSLSSGTQALYQTTTAGMATPLFPVPVNAAPGGDRGLGAAGTIGISPDGTVLAYWGNILGGDTSEASDTVTVVGPRTGTHRTVSMPAGRAHPLRVTSVWVSSAHVVYATAWRQPWNPTTQGLPSNVTVVPHEYRLGPGGWTDLGVATVRGDGGQNGWTATITGSRGILAFSNPPGELVASAGSRHVNLAADVTDVAWAPAS